MSGDAPQGERIARLEEITNAIKDDVAAVKQDVASVRSDVAALDLKLDTRGIDSAKQFQDLKDILLAQNVARQTRLDIGKTVKDYGGWVLTNLVIIAAAIIGAHIWPWHR